MANQAAVQPKINFKKRTGKISGKLFYQQKFISWLNI